MECSEVRWQDGAKYPNQNLPEESYGTQRDLIWVGIGLLAVSSWQRIVPQNNKKRDERTPNKLEGPSVFWRE